MSYLLSSIFIIPAVIGEILASPIADNLPTPSPSSSSQSSKLAKDTSCIGGAGKIYQNGEEDSNGGRICANDKWQPVGIADSSPAPPATPFKDTPTPAPATSVPPTPPNNCPSSVDRYDPFMFQCVKAGEGVFQKEVLCATQNDLPYKTCIDQKRP